MLCVLCIFKSTLNDMSEMGLNFSGGLRVPAKSLF